MRSRGKDLQSRFSMILSEAQALKDRLLEASGSVEAQAKGAEDASIVPPKKPARKSSVAKGKLDILEGGDEKKEIDAMARELELIQIEISRLKALLIERDSKALTSHRSTENTGILSIELYEVDVSGDQYLFLMLTAESSLPDGWKEVLDKTSNRVYYVNK